MKSRQLFHLLCDTYEIPEGQFICWLNFKATHPNSPSSIRIESRDINDDILFMIINDVLISVISEDKDND